MKKTYPSIKHNFIEYAANQDGSGTITSMFGFIIMASVAGIAIDSSNGWRSNAHLKGAVDAAALAGVNYIDAVEGAPDQDDAIAIAVETANLNLGGTSNVVTAADVTVGVWDEATSSVRDLTDDEDETAFNAVRVYSELSADRSNAIDTFALRFMGLNQLETRARSIAVAGTVLTEEEVEVDCSSGGIFTTGSISPSGGSAFYNGFCIHASEGVSDGGSTGFYDQTVVSSVNKDNIDLGAHIDGRDDDEIKAEGTWSSPLIESLSSTYAQLEANFSGQHNTEVTLQKTDEDETDETDVTVEDDGLDAAATSLVPEFVFGDDDTAQIIEVFVGDQLNTVFDDVSQYDYWWSGTLQPRATFRENSIYVIHGDMALTDVTVLDNTAVIVLGDVYNYGGVPAMENVYLMTKNMYGGGTLSFGPNSDTDTCGDEVNPFSVYMYGVNSLSFGGGDRANGLLVATPNLSINGGFNGTNIHMETYSNLNFGGAYSIAGCPMSSEDETSPLTITTTVSVSGGATLVR